jgi:hypothetical protein
VPEIIVVKRLTRYLEPLGEPQHIDGIGLGRQVRHTAKFRPGCLDQ